MEALGHRNLSHSLLEEGARRIILQGRGLPLPRGSHLNLDARLTCFLVEQLGFVGVWCFLHAGEQGGALGEFRWGVEKNRLQE